MKSVYLAASALDAQLIYDQLKDAGYEVFIAGVQLAGALGELPVNATPEVKVLKDEQYLAARALVEEILEDREKNNNHSGNCIKCGEALEQGFQQCWNCGSIYQQN